MATRVEVTEPDPSVEITPGSDTLEISEAGWGIELRPGDGVWQVEAATPSVEVLPVGSPALASDGSVSVTIEAVSTQGPPGAGSPALEDLTFSYSGGQLDQVAGETYTRTLTYDGNGRVFTIHDSDTGTTQTLSYDAGTGLPVARTIS